MNRMAIFKPPCSRQCTRQSMDDECGPGPTAPAWRSCPHDVRTRQTKPTLPQWQSSRANTGRKARERSQRATSGGSKAGERSQRMGSGRQEVHERSHGIGAGREVGVRAKPFRPEPRRRRANEAIATPGGAEGPRNERRRQSIREIRPGVHALHGPQTCGDRIATQEATPARGTVSPVRIPGPDCLGGNGPRTC